MAAVQHTELSHFVGISEVWAWHYAVVMWFSRVVKCNLIIQTNHVPAFMVNIFFSSKLTKAYFRDYVDAPFLASYVINLC